MLCMQYNLLVVGRVAGGQREGNGCQRLELLKTFPAIETLKALSKRATSRIWRFRDRLSKSMRAQERENLLENLSSKMLLIRLVELLDCEP